MKKLIATAIVTLGIFNSGPTLADTDVDVDPIPPSYGQCVYGCVMGGKGWVAGPFGYAYCAIYCSMSD